MYPSVVKFQGQGFLVRFLDLWGWGMWEPKAIKGKDVSFEGTIRDQNKGALLGLNGLIREPEP